MSQPAPLTLAVGQLTIDSSPVIRITACVLQLHEEHELLAPSRDSTDRLLAPTVRWLEVTLTLAAASPLPGLALLTESFPCVLTLGTQSINVSSARLIGYRATLDNAEATEHLTLRCERWTIEES